MREQSIRHGAPHSRGEHRPYQGNGKANRFRPRRSANLGRLRDELGFDMLAAALGLTDEALTILIDGRDHVRAEQYATHMVHRLKEAGIPNDWLERQFAPIAPEYLRALRKFAAASPNKAPIRRANFRRLALTFDGRTTVLADALDMVPSSIENVAEGRLEFDDGRFGHINPRLMQAGFPDGWLEQPEPDLTDAMIASVGKLAMDEYERQHAEEEEHRLAQAQAFVNQAPAQQIIPTEQPTSAPSDTTLETAMATAGQRQAKSTKSTQNKLTPPTTPNFKAAGMPGASKPLAHPSAAGGKTLPRSVLLAGRKVTGAGKTGRPPAAAPAPAPVATPSTATTKAATTQAPAAARAPSARQSTGVTREQSNARAMALEQLLENSRRGAKVTLWRDTLGSSLPLWGNIRRGAVLFRDDLARGVEVAMGLPANWLDNPVFPPKTMAAWVTDPNAPVPTPLELHADATESAEASGQAAPAAAESAATTDAAKSTSSSKPFARNKAVAQPQVTMSPPPSTPAGSPSIASQAPAPVAAPAAQTPAAAAASFAAPQLGQTSPMVATLLSLIQARVATGTFTDNDALKLIHALSASA